MQNVWYRKYDGWWYATSNRGGEQKQIKLHRGPNTSSERAKAEEQLIIKLAEQLQRGEPDCGKTPKWLTVGHVVTAFIAFANRELPTTTAQWYRRVLDGFVDGYGGLKIRDLRKRHVLAFAKKKYTNPNSQNQVVAAVKRAFAWAHEEEHIPANPVAHVKKPNKAQPRDRILEQHERDLIKTQVKDDAFRDYFQALSMTGARPGEVARVTADQCNLEQGYWILREHKTARKTGRPRIIYLPPDIIEMTKRLMVKNPTGPIFRNLRGDPWTANAVRLRFQRLRKKYPQLKGVIATTLRHSFATDALERSIGDADVAALLGHSSTRMLHAVYSKLHKRHDHLRLMAVRATGDGEEPRTPAKSA